MGFFIETGVSQDSEGNGKENPLNEDISLGWRRSSRCANSGCVEVARRGDKVVVRDSKIDDSPVLSYTSDEWGAFVAGVKAGEFDHHRLL
jgi:hypothetical protein